MVGVIYGGGLEPVQCLLRQAGHQNQRLRIQNDEPKGTRVKPMTEYELREAIEETKRQEATFRLADDRLNTAHWILERVKLRSQLAGLIIGQIR